MVLPEIVFYINERKESRELEHRKVSLEELFTNYAFYYSMKNDEISVSRLEKLYAILDKHYEELEDRDIKGTLRWRMSLGRMDIRNMDVQETEVDNQKYNVYTPVFDEDVEANRVAILEEHNLKLRFLGLLGWGREKYKRENISEHNKIFDNDVSRVFHEFNQYLNDPQKDEESHSILGRELEYMIPAVMYREYKAEMD